MGRSRSRPHGGVSSEEVLRVGRAGWRLVPTPFGSQSNGCGEGGTFSSTEKRGVCWERRPGPYTLQPSGLKAVFCVCVFLTQLGFGRLSVVLAITLVVLVAWEFRVRAMVPHG